VCIESVCFLVVNVPEISCAFCCSLKNIIKNSVKPCQPLTGEVFYLDLPSNRITESLESDIKDLGGTVEKFFSKEIKYLVSNKKEARYVQCLRQSSPVPSPDSGQSSPHQTGNHGDNFAASRGKSLVERVVKQQERVRMSKILSNAQEWGVKILYIDDIIAYLQKKKKVTNSQYPATTAIKTNVRLWHHIIKFDLCRISKPFIKVEDSSRHYCPIYLTMPNMPQFNLKTLPPCTPFFVEEKDPPTNKPSVKISASEERGHCRKKNRDKKGGGYCECCAIKYVNITTHIQSERHKAFSKSDKYLVLDKLISAMMGTAPSRGEFGSSPYRLTQVDSVDRIITEHMSSSVSIRNNEVSSVKLNGMTGQQEQIHLEQNSSTFEYVQDGNVLPDKIADNNLSGKEGVSFSPVRKIQRRVRVYKRKRRKVETNVEHVKPSDIPVNFKLELLELF
uniref:Protein DBF4 homolog A n=1 Tax=Mola mola TaxID=94237 RepID=A0A3Q4AJR4_MOLML